MKINLLKIYIGLSMLLIFGGIFSFLIFSIYVVITKQYTIFGIKFLYFTLLIFLIGVVMLVLPLAKINKNSGRNKKWE
ncbi:MAG: hypothetical protein AMJ90_06825 [candidate division Zixibacteria bacterium SM23_73_2]|nr:MAG: hypothetical protein AMJ90_06825 [candidate division Zixibacteria bacterium SM23_73_2]